MDKLIYIMADEFQACKLHYSNIWESQNTDGDDFRPILITLLYGHRAFDFKEPGKSIDFENAMTTKTEALEFNEQFEGNLASVGVRFR